jgi:NAD(P)-dependent dehydrogenase (short-subunit alcohol dehydrogenase family)
MTRPLRDQVVVITGASSGVGRETALQFGRQGSSVVLAARNDQALDSGAREVERLGGQAIAVPTDVSEWGQVQALADRAVERFGRIDTWVNNAAVNEYALFDDMTVEEIDRIIRTDLLGTIYGAKAALPHLKAGGGGVIVNVGSVESKRGMPLQSAYSAAKHGVKGFTDALRLELEHEQVPVHVSLLLPTSINTPLFDHARSKLGAKPRPIPPVYEPEVVARAVLEVAQRPLREVVVGGAGKGLTAAERFSPAVLDRLLLGPGKVFQKQKGSQPPGDRDNLEAAPTGPGSATGSFGQKSKSSSLFTQTFELHPERLRALVAGTAVLAAVALRRAGRREMSRRRRA